MCELMVLSCCVKHVPTYQHISPALNHGNTVAHARNPVRVCTWRYATAKRRPASDALPPLPFLRADFLLIGREYEGVAWRNVDCRLGRGKEEGGGMFEAGREGRGIWVLGGLGDVCLFFVGGGGGGGGGYGLWYMDCVLCQRYSERGV